MLESGWFPAYQDSPPFHIWFPVGILCLTVLNSLFWSLEFLHYRYSRKVLFFQFNFKNYVCSVVLIYHSYETFVSSYMNLDFMLPSKTFLIRSSSDQIWILFVWFLALYDSLCVQQEPPNLLKVELSSLIPRILSSLLHSDFSQLAVQDLALFFDIGLPPSRTIVPTILSAPPISSLLWHWSFFCTTEIRCLTFNST